MPIIISKFSGKCRVCRNGYVAGDRVFWQKGVKGATCITCFEPENPGPGTIATPTPVPVPYEPPTTPRRQSGRVQLPANHAPSPHIIREFGSWDAYVECASQCENVLGSSGSHAEPREWNGNLTYAQSVSLAREGWQECHSEVNALIDNLDAKIAPKLQPAFVSYFDVSGGAVDVGRYLDGEPECMIETRLIEIAKPGKVVTILVNCGFRASIKPADIRKRGAAIVGLINALEKMQHSTEVILEASCAENPDRQDRGVLTHLVHLKGAANTLDDDTLMFALAHPARHRRLTFAIREQEGERARFGIDYRHGESSVESRCVDMVGADVHLDMMVSSGETAVANAEEWIQKNLVALGLLAEGD